MIAPVGQPSRQRRQAPQPSGTAAAASASGADVTTDPKTNHEPRPGTSRLAFLPNQPIPARCATSRSTKPLSSTKTFAS
jgi:hypothetical protein